MDAKELLLWFARQEIALQQQIMQSMMDVRREYLNDCRLHKKKPVETPENIHGYLTKAIRIAWRESDGRKLSIRDDLILIDQKKAELDALKLKSRSARKPVKREKLEGEWEHIIEKLREEGLSYSRICDYLATNHKKRISKSYLFKVFNNRDYSTKSVSVEKAQEY